MSGAPVVTAGSPDAREAALLIACAELVMSQARAAAAAAPGDARPPAYRSGWRLAALREGASAVSHVDHAPIWSPT